jgi:hypothetical protein
MRRSILLACALVITASAAQAQSSDKDFAAWFGMMVTPVGAFPQMETAPGGRTDGAAQLALRLSSWKFEGSTQRQNNYGVSYLAPSSSKLRYGLTVGWMQASGGGSSDGTLMLGGDLASALWQSAANPNSATTFSLDWKASLGYGRFTGSGGGNAWSIVGQLPFKWMYQMANKSDLSAFASAGFGFAGVSDDFNDDSGTRPMLSFGGAWTSAGGVGVHLGTQKILLDFGSGGGSPPWNTGLAVSFPVGGKK